MKGHTAAKYAGPGNTTWTPYGARMPKVSSSNCSSPGTPFLVPSLATNPLIYLAASNRGTLSARQGRIISGWTPACMTLRANKAGPRRGCMGYWSCASLYASDYHSPLIDSGVGVLRRVSGTVHVLPSFIHHYLSGISSTYHDLPLDGTRAVCGFLSYEEP